MRVGKMECARGLVIGILVCCSACATSEREQEMAFSGDGWLYRHYSSAKIPELLIKTRYGVAFPSFSLDKDYSQEYLFADLPQNNASSYFIFFVPDAAAGLPSGWRIDFALIDAVDERIVFQDAGSADCWRLEDSLDHIYQYMPDGRKQYVSRHEYSYSPNMTQGPFPLEGEPWSEEWQKKFDEWRGGFYPESAKSYRLKVHFVPPNENTSTQSLGTGHFEIRQSNLI